MIGEEGNPDEPGDGKSDGDPQDLNDPVKVKRRQTKAQARDELRKRFIARMLSERDGREWFWDVLTRGHIFATSFVSGDPMATAFREGERNIALSILAEIMDANPHAYALMAQESADG